MSVHLLKLQRSLTYIDRSLRCQPSLTKWHQVSVNFKENYSLTNLFFLYRDYLVI